MPLSLPDRLLLAYQQITNITGKTLDDLEPVAMAALGIPRIVYGRLNYQARLRLVEEFSLDLVIYTRAGDAIEDRFGEVITIRDLD